MMKLFALLNRNGFVLAHTLVLVLFFSSFFVNLSMHHIYQKEQLQLEKDSKIVSLLHYEIVSQIKAHNSDFNVSIYDHQIDFIYHSEEEIVAIVSGQFNFRVEIVMDVDNQVIKSYNNSGN